MNLDNYYLHATGGYEGEENYQNRIIKILETGEIIPSKENRHYSSSPENQVCLVDPRKLKNNSAHYNDSAFHGFVLYCPTIAIKRDIPVEEYKKSLHIDEVRYSGKIAIDKIKMILFPFYWNNSISIFEPEDKIEQLEIFRENIAFISKEFTTIPLKEIYTGKDITMDAVDRQIEIYQKRLR